jgi:hypothetical protein
MGLMATSSIVLIQEIVPWEQRGAATASNLFARNLGSTLGATVLGAVLNVGLAQHGRETGAGTVGSDELRHLLERGGAAAGAGSDAVRAVLHGSLHVTFLAVFALSLLVVVLCALVPATTVGRTAPAAPQPAE